jgi:hypothetical protein
MVIIQMMVTGIAMAQTLPNPDWPLDSVVNGSVHKYTVTGDQNYDSPSSFVWTVEGGQLYLDEDLTVMLGDGVSDTIIGDLDNVTTLWVVWNSFTQPIDTGYVYVYEISADGCQRANTDDDKYQGMLIKVSAPPTVYFLTDEISTCSNADEGIIIDIVIDGMPPFDLTYSVNGVEEEWYIETDNLVDSDLDGEVNNVTITIDDFIGTTLDQIYQLELLEASSGGVLGDIIEYSSLTVYAYVQPDAPVLNRDWLEVTTGQTHNYSLEEAGVDPDLWYWELYDDSDNMVWDTSSTISNVDISLDFDAGEYVLMSYFLSNNGCLSLSDTMTITVFDSPVLSFDDASLDVVACSESTYDSGVYFEFILNYQGATTYYFIYRVYDYNGNIVIDTTLEHQTSRELTITIPNTFINDDPDIKNRDWKVMLMEGKNEEGVEIEILDSDIEGGSDERLITIHPKPVIYDDIDFEN